ncbi:MAG: hypothetical protein KDK48_00170 [Chlamydiia bacterium]|nr:hypothetical protein [Chlamydiia bacterium]
MKLLKTLGFALVAVASACGASLHADGECCTDSFHSCCAQRDFEAVQELVNSKRTIPLEEKDCNLSIAGDIRFNWANILERINCEKLRGRNGIARQEPETCYVTIAPPIGGPDGTGVPFSASAWDIEMNLYIDYVCGRSWGVAWIEYNNAAGIGRSKKTCATDPQGMFGSGCKDGLCLRKAYMGYNIMVDGCSRLDIELGRRPLYTLFDSRIQFQNNMDGAVMKYARKVDGYGDMYAYGGAFVVDERANNYAWIVETGLLNCGYTGADLRYSYVDYKTLMHHNANRCDVAFPFGCQFQISQITAAYNFLAPTLCIPVKLYGAFLINTAAPHDDLLNEENTASRKNIGWYAGFIINQVCKAGDWALDINYQYVEPFAVPENDVSGIGRNGRNLLGETMTANGRGFPNYRGWRFELLYAITDNLSLDGSFEFSREIYNNMWGTLSTEPSGRINYSKFEVEAIYAF